jgi:predicted P-loop ATPase
MKKTAVTSPPAQKTELSPHYRRPADAPGAQSSFDSEAADREGPEGCPNVSPPDQAPAARSAVPATGDSRKWRDELPRLARLNLPLLPCGAGHEWKAPVDPQTGSCLLDWPTKRFTVPEILAMNGAVICAGTRTGNGLLAFDQDGGSALELLLVHGCDPQQAKTWQVRRDTDPLRLKVLWQLTAEQQAELGGEVIKAIKTKAPADCKKGEALELFHSTGKQVVVLGEHRASGGDYFWPEGQGPEALAPIPDAWWTLALKIARGEIEGIHTPAAATPKTSSQRGEWEPANPCPICGRNTTSWCTTRIENGSINCRHGSTFSPLLAHGTLTPGQVITGTDGVRYAFCSEKRQSDGQMFSTFKVHQERPRDEQKQRKHKLPANFAGLIHSLQDGWQLEESDDGMPARRTKRALSVGQFAQMLPLDSLRFNRLELMAEVQTATGWQVIRQQDMDSASVLLDQKGWKIGNETTTRALVHVAHQNRHHPVNQYLLNLEKRTDLQPFPLDDVAPRFLRAGGELHCTMVRKWLIGAVARALQPGCQMDYCLTLKGRQGIHKSGFFMALATREWHSSTAPDQDKDFLLNVHACWLFELAELESHTSKRDAGRLKNIITTPRDRFRPPYGKSPEPFDRQSVFCSTVNADEFFRDETGNRRFWVVPVVGTEKIDTAAVRAARDGIWLAAIHAYRAGELPMLPDHLAEESEVQNVQFREEDPWEPRLIEWLERGPIDGCLKAPESFTTSQALAEANLKDQHQITRGDEMRVAAILRKHGWEREDQRRENGKPVRKWRQRVSQPSQPVTTSPVGGCDTPEGLQRLGSQLLSQPSQPFLKERRVGREMGQEGQKRGEMGKGWIKAMTGCDTREEPLRPLAATGLEVSQPPVTTSRQLKRGCDTPPPPPPATNTAWVALTRDMEMPPQPVLCTRRHPITPAQVEQALEEAIASGNLRNFLPQVLVVGRTYEPRDSHVSLAYHQRPTAHPLASGEPGELEGEPAGSQRRESGKASEPT